MKKTVNNNTTPTTFKKRILFYIAAATLFIGVKSADAQGITVVAKRTAATQSATTIAAPAGLHLKFEMDSVVYDEIGIYYNAGWSDKYDDNDSYDLDGLNPHVYLSSFTADGVRVSINAWDNYTTPSRIKLYVRSTTSGSYTLSIEDFVNIDTAHYNINLVDNEQKDSINMAKYGTYTFNFSTADTAAFDNRFVLAVEPKDTVAVKPPLPYQLALFGGEKILQGVQLDWKTVNAGNTTNFTVQKLNTTNSYDSLYTVKSDSATTTYNYVDQHPIIGNNVYRLKQVTADGKIAYSSAVTIGYGSATTSTALNVYPNPSKSTINVKLTTGTTGAIYFADIYNMSGSLVKHQSVTSGIFSQDISTYKHGAYFITLKDANGYVLGQTKFVKADQ